MKIIISPAKKMKRDLDFLPPNRLPKYLEKTERLKEYLQSLSYQDLKQLLSCNDQIAQQNFQRYQNMDLFHQLTPAILAYEGIQYQYMAPQVFETDYFQYIQEHLRILSGFYGILKPFDGVVPYRLEMQAKLKIDRYHNLYEYWGDSLYQTLAHKDDTILNLASKEYSKIVKKYLSPRIRWIDCTFGEWVDGKIKEKGVYVKMARGQMVRFMAEHNLEDVEGIQKFDRLGYQYQPDLSQKDHFIFLK